MGTKQITRSRKKVIVACFDLPGDPIMSTKVWQGAFMDVFRLVNLHKGWDGAVREGDVTWIMDKTLHHRVLRIMGSISAGNYVRVPKGGNSLGLTGRYLYVMTRPLEGKYFVVHVDLATKESAPVRISISNMYPKPKVSGSNNIQLPFKSSGRGRWTVIAVDVAKVLGTFVQNRTFANIRRVQLGSAQHCRGVFTSNKEYAVESLPREMEFRCDHGQQWNDLYEWVWLTKPISKTKGTIKSLAKPEREAPKPKKRLTTTKSVKTPMRVSFRKKKNVPPASTGKQQMTTPSAPSDAPWLRLNRVLGFSGLLVVSPDTQTVVYAASSMVVIHHMDTGEQRFLMGHVAPITSMSMSGDGTILATAESGSGALIRVWHFATGRCLAVARGHESDVTFVDVSKDGKRMVAVGLDGRSRQLVVLWDISQLLVQGVDGHGKLTLLAKQVSDMDVKCVRFVPFQQDHFVTVGARSVRIWRLRHDRLHFVSIHLEENATRTFTDVGFGMDVGGSDEVGQRMYTCTTDGMVIGIDYATQEVEGAYSVHSAAVRCIAVHGGFCVTGSDDGMLRVWPLEFGSFRMEAEFEAPVSVVSLSKDCLTIVSGTTDGTIGTLDVASHGCKMVARAHTDAVVTVAMDKDRREFATSSKDRTVRVWDMDTGEQVYHFSTPNVAGCLAYRPGKHELACGFEDGAMRAFLVSEGSSICEHYGHRSAVMDLTFADASHGRWMYSAAMDGRIVLYDAEAEYEPVRMVSNGSMSCPGMAASPDGSKLAFLGTERGAVNVVHATTLAPALALEVESMDKKGVVGVTAVAFSEDSRRFAVATEDFRLDWFDVADGSLISHTVAIHEGPVHALTVRGRLAFTGGDDKTVKVWDYGRGLGNRVPTFQAFVGHADGIACIGAEPEARCVVSTDSSGCVFVWELDSDALEKKEEEDEVRQEPTPFRDARVVARLPQRHVLPTRGEIAPLARRVYSPREGEEGLQLIAVSRFGGGRCNGVLWHPPSGLFSYACGPLIVVEGLRTRRQTHFCGHSEVISALTMSTDGTLLVSAVGRADANTGCAEINLWTLPSKKPARTLCFHESGVQTLALNPDASLLLSCGNVEECSVVVWDVSAGVVLATGVTAHAIHAAAWNPHEEREFVTVGQGSITFWLLVAQEEEEEGDDGEVKTGWELRMVEAKLPDTLLNVHFTDVSFRPDTRDMFVACSNGSVITWDAAKNEYVSSWLAESEAREVGLLCALGEDELITGDAGGRVCRWSVHVEPDAPTEVTQHTCAEVDAPIVSMAMSEEGDEGVVGTSAGTLWCVSLLPEPRESMCLSAGHTDMVMNVAFDASGSLLASASADGSVRIWSVRHGVLEQLFLFQEQHVGAQAMVVAFPPRSRHRATPLWVAGGFDHGALRLLDVAGRRAGPPVFPYGEDIPITAMVWVAPSVVLMGNAAGCVAAVDPLTSAVLWSTEIGEDMVITGVDVDRASSRWLASCSNGHVVVWKGTVHEGGVEVEFVDRFVVGYGKVGWVRKCKKEMQSVPGSPFLARFSKSEPGVIVHARATPMLERSASQDALVPETAAVLGFYHVEQGKDVRTIRLAHPPLCMDVSSSGLVVLGSMDRLVTLVDGEEGAFQDFRGHADAVSSVAFTANSRMVASACKGGAIMLWDVSA